MQLTKLFVITSFCLCTLYAGDDLSNIDIPLINQQKIPQSRINAFIKMQGSQKNIDQFKDQMIITEILRQEAVRSGADRDKDLLDQLDAVKASILAQGVIQNFSKNNPPSEQELLSRYEELKKNTPPQVEYRVRHILVQTEKQAKDLIKQVKSGASFGALADRYSLDKGTDQGELGWHVPSSFVEPFANRMVALNKGEMTSSPVKTDFGWHVIQLQDVRKPPFKTFEELRPMLLSQIMNEKTKAYLDDLKAKSIIGS
jgi:peptidyl-prolyl cis-trans isomerase C